MTFVRAAVVAVLVIQAVVLQVAGFAFLSFGGVVPNLALLLVVATALVRGPDAAASDPEILAAVEFLKTGTAQRVAAE